MSAARSQLNAVRRQARADTEKAAAAAESKTREYVDKFREQVCAWKAGEGVRHDWFILGCGSRCLSCSRGKQDMGVGDKFRQQGTCCRMAWVWVVCWASMREAT